MSFRSEGGSIAALCDRPSDNKIAEIDLSPSGRARRLSPTASLLAQMALPFCTRRSLSDDSGVPNSTYEHYLTGSQASVT
jgi:hypothetical protein